MLVIGRKLSDVCLAVDLVSEDLPSVKVSAVGIVSALGGVDYGR